MRRGQEQVAARSRQARQTALKACSEKAQAYDNDRPCAAAIIFAAPADTAGAAAAFKSLPGRELPCANGQGFCWKNERHLTGGGGAAERRLAATAIVGTAKAHSRQHSGPSWFPKPQNRAGRINDDAELTCAGHLDFFLWDLSA